MSRMQNDSGVAGGRRPAPSRRRRWFVKAILVIGGPLAVFGLLAGANIHASSGKFSAPPKVVPGTAGDAVRQDVAYVRQMPDVDRSFAPQAAVEFRRQIAEIGVRGDSISPAESQMRLTRAVALADNGHSYVRGIAKGRDLATLPVRFVWFSDGLYIVAAEPAHADLLGAQVVAEAGRPAAQMAALLRPYVGGAESLKRLMSVNFMASPPALHAAGLASSPRSVAFSLRLPDGRMVERELSATDHPSVGRADDDRWPIRNLSPTPVAGDQQDMRHVLGDASNVPLYLRDADRPFRFAYIRPDVLYVQIRRIRNSKAIDATAALSQILSAAAARPPKYAVVDMRASPGGTYEFAAEFTKRLPQLVRSDGKIFILIGPNTFSAGIVTVARLKYFSGDRAVLIGEPMGDHERFWAEGGRATLPNSRTDIRYATAMHDWKSGCGIGDLLRCYWLNYILGVRAGSLAPQVTTPLSFADYRAGRDPALSAAAQIIAEDR